MRAAINKIQIKMKTNMGTVDKVVRILITIVIVCLYYTQVITGTLAIILLVVSGVLILTSIIGFCPLYLLFRINTGKKKK